MTDRLSLANALAEAKIDRPAAERIATEIFEAIHDSVATKANLQLLRSELKADIQHIEGRIDALRNEIALLEPRLLIRLGGVMVVPLGLLFAALRYLPPVH